MLPLPITQRLKQRWLIALLVGAFAMLLWNSRPTDAENFYTSIGAQIYACAPSIDLVPSQDGADLFVNLDRFEPCGTICLRANPGTWPVNPQRCCTTTPCILTISGLTPRTSASGSLVITSTQGTDIGPVDFHRAYFPAQAAQSIYSLDGGLQLTIVSTDTFPAELYIAVIGSLALPGPPASGHRFIEPPHSVRASGALLLSDRPMSLRLYYTEKHLARSDPHTLAIFAWDAFQRRWQNLGGRLISDHSYLAVATSRFTTYALMGTSSWQDEFADGSGLDLSDPNNVSLVGPPEDRALVLADTPGSGSAVSRLITPTSSFGSWGSLTLSYTVAPPTTTLMVDVLSLEGRTVLTDVASGTDLSGLDPAQHRALKLRARLASAVRGETPALEKWRLTWTVAEQKLYVPIIAK